MWAASLLSLLLLFAPAGSSTGHQQPHRGGADGDAAAVVLPGRRDIPTAVEPVRSRQLQQQLQLVGEQPHGRKLLAGRGHSVEDGQLQRPPEHAYVALCAIVRNENDYIREWIDYHHFIGVDKFYVFDHMSSPPVRACLGGSTTGCGVASAAAGTGPSHGRGGCRATGPPCRDGVQRWVRRRSPVAALHVLWWMQLGPRCSSTGTSLDSMAQQQGSRCFRDPCDQAVPTWDFGCGMRRLDRFPTHALLPPA